MHYKRHLVISVMLVLLSVQPCAAEQALTVTLEAGANLGELLTEALKSNPEILAARKAVEAAQARIIQARSLDDPEVNVESWMIPLNQPTNLNRANTHMVNFRQRLPFPGKLRLKGEVATQEQAMAAARYRAKEREIIADARKVTPISSWPIGISRLLKSNSISFSESLKQPKLDTRLGRLLNRM